MKKKLSSIFFKRIDFPSFLELRIVFRGLHVWEKVTVLILIFIMGIGTVGVWTQLQNRFALALPISGGSFKEGIVGIPHLVNPLLASTDVDRDLVNLLYAGLMKPDGHGELEKNMASAVEISQDGLSYTFTLKNDLVWHDGEPLTTRDIAFTIQAVKNPALKSPLRANWEGVEIEVIDDKTIRFWLKRAYAPFLGNATLGILPKHIWKDTTPEQFSLSELNRRVIGSGPYKIQRIKRNTEGIVTVYRLKAFKSYALKKPFITRIELLFYNSEDELLTAFKKGGVDAASSLSAENVNSLREEKNIEKRLKTLTLPRIFGVFFNQNKSELLQSKKIREALDKAVDKPRLVEEVLGGYGVTLDDPIPPDIVEYAPPFQLTSFNLASAEAILENAGWKINDETKIREKKEKKKGSVELQFSLSTANTPELVAVAQRLRTMWQTLGVKTDIRIFEIGDLNQNVIRPREYEALLFGEVIGLDPDLFAFWHSSQMNDPGLNIALYANKNVDKLLEEARTITDRAKRKNKYVEFLKEIRQDVPAVFLYSPHYLYIAPPSLKGFDTEIITIPGERFANVHRWHMYTERVWKIFVK
ncbi:peptide ABC transporter substrate-binding protein [Patescibacteria group bacterium]|nr:peptide ABC transporter substrate-binding protein [Patescibacteria group bacterium]